ncbi:MAG: transaldolase family protein [Actinomycetales bacterium]
MEASLSASPLLTMTQTTKTVLWNDSADPAELTQAMEWGVVGATCNPVIALACVRADLPRWTARIKELAAENPTMTQDEIGWRVVEELSVDAARLLEPAFSASNGRNGRLSMQTDPRLYRSAQALADQAEHFAGLAENIIVKVPATKIGIEAIEEATYRGVSMNVTVSFTVAQAVESAEAIERGLRRREAEGLDVSTMGPVVTIMVGRLDDWMKDCAKAGKVSLDPGYYEWAGVAAFKKAYQIFVERGLRSRLLSAAFRNHLHWSQLIGGDVVISPPFAFQQLFNVSGIESVERIDEPVDKQIVDALYEKLPDFRKAYDVDGMTIEEFEDFGATRKTLRQFLAAANELEAIVRDVLIPAP